MLWYVTELRIVESGEMLTDEHMWRASCMLKTQYPTVLGLQSTLLHTSQQGFRSLASTDGTAVQIHHVKERSHWVVSCRLPDEPSIINIYDSVRRDERSLTDSLVDQLSAIYGYDCCFDLPEMQQQNNAVDCGLFAIAAAVDICSGINPSKRTYNQNAFRKHFAECIRADTLTSFP